jgi:hypothetical protein
MCGSSFIHINPIRLANPQPPPQAFKGYEAASEAGHWKAPLRLAQMHARGRGTPTNCSKAARLFLVFLEEQSGWTEDSDAAMDALDDKDDWGALVLFLRR